MNLQKPPARRCLSSTFLSLSLLIFTVAGCSMFSKPSGESSSAANSVRSGNSAAESDNSRNSSVVSSTAPVAKPTVPASQTAPPTPGFEKFALLEVGDFKMEQAFSVFSKSVGYLKNIDYRYKYADGRNARLHGPYGVDAQMQIWEFDSPEKAQAQIKKRIAKAVPIEKADSVKLPRCVGEKSDSDEFVGPEKLVKRLKHPNGGDIFILRDGDFNNFDCTRESNRGEYAVWTDGVYYFSVHTTGFLAAGKGNKAYTGNERAEEFALAYLKALGQPIAASGD